MQAAGPSRRASGGRLARRPGSGARTGAAPLLRERCRVRGRRRPPHNGAAMAAAGAATPGVRAAATAAAPAPSPFLTSLPLRARAQRAGGPRGWGLGIGAGGGAGAAAGPGRRARPAGDPAPRRVRIVSCRPKRQPKPSSDEGYWDCSVCTFRNSAEAFKCMMCDVRKGTSTRWVLGLPRAPSAARVVAQRTPLRLPPPPVTLADPAGGGESEVVAAIGIGSDWSRSRRWFAVKGNWRGRNVICCQERINYLREALATAI